MGNSKNNKQRIVKYLARVGIGSRRKIEQYIIQGRISVDGQILKTPVCFVDEKSSILFDKKKVGLPTKTLLFKFYKPKGLVTSHSDERGRKTVFESLPAKFPRLMSVGRLDLNSEGLLLLTNNGELARKLELPINNWKRKYKVRAYGIIKNKDIDKLNKGIKIKNFRYKPIETKIINNKKNNIWLEMTLTEGKNREIRKILEFLNLNVNRLIRVSYGPILLGNLKPGKINKVDENFIKNILD